MWLWMWLRRVCVGGGGDSEREMWMWMSGFTWGMRVVGVKDVCDACGMSVCMDLWLLRVNGFAWRGCIAGVVKCV